MARKSLIIAPKSPIGHTRHKSASANGSRTNVLVVVDESRASRRAVAYVARLIGRRRGFQLCLVHLLPQLPPRLLEFRGGEDPTEEKRLDARLKVCQQRWIATARKTASRTLAAVDERLRKAGVPARAVGFRFSEAVNGRRAVDRIIELARTRKCQTVVVGRESVSWFRGFFRSDLSEELVRRGERLTIWIVE